ncbi:hypothetical protein [Paractinoplanes toevensis]|uniref:Uncharacterized protein n=1 Tax=Paractinoplanes toevensis TaxID=571911 RepID=A0A919WD54_9ACTN|nr:hypothetical protein [Actinoplanes toevensis]GIM97952.1 hypothetical protein Ato02nite_097450 [Actinoplanes toevensis]
MREQSRDRPDPFAGLTDPTERILNSLFRTDQLQLSRRDILVIRVRSYLEYVSGWRWRVRRDPELRARIAAVRDGTFDPVAWREAEKRCSNEP